MPLEAQQYAINPGTPSPPLKTSTFWKAFAGTALGLIFAGMVYLVIAHHFTLNNLIRWVVAHQVKGDAK